MAKKKKSALPPLPQGDFEFTSGQNYGLDGFDFKDEYGEGVLEAARLPEVKGLSSLPGDFFGAKEAGGELESDFEPTPGPDLTGMLHEGATQTPNLNWLSLTEGYEPPLPEDPTDGMLDELVEAWGNGVGTTGTHVSANRIDPSLTRGYVEETPRPTLPRQELVEKLRAASRDSAKGAPIKSVLATFEGDIVAPKDRDILTRGLEQIQNEHGLAGKVFVRAAAYPGCESRRWSKHVAREASEARYLVAAHKCQGCVHNEDGRCQILRKNLVSDVPWAKALKAFSPRFKMAGVARRKGEHPRDTLLRGFAKMGSYVVEEREQYYHIVQDPTAGISFEEAAREIRANPVVQEKVEATDHSHRRKTARALSKIRQWGEEQILSPKAVEVLSRLARKDPKRALAKATEYIWKVGGNVGEYQGEGERAAYRRSTDTEKRVDVAAEQKAINAEVRKGLATRIGGFVKASLLTQKEVEKLLGLGFSPRRTLRLASKLVEQKELQEERRYIEAEEAPAYEGEGAQAIPNFEEGMSLTAAERELAKAKFDPKVHPREIKGALRWAAQKISEGAAGKELDELLSTRFSKLVLQAASEELRVLRAHHEGLAGQLYVDSSVYATKEGFEGCKVGAQKHRGNAVQFVMGMRRCNGCTLNSAGFCQRYDKQIVFEPPVDDPEAYQQEALRLANASDAEVTASLFAPSGAEMVEKFGGLTNAMQADFELTDQNSDDLGEILWGMEVDLGEE
jgi:hypothetical protein